MTHQMTVTLTDQEYQILTEEAEKNGKQPETFLHDIIQNLRSSSTKKYAMTEREFAEKLYREGVLLNLASPRPLTEEEQAERERLSKLFAGGKPASEMVIEDRGPY